MTNAAMSNKNIIHDHKNISTHILITLKAFFNTVFILNIKLK